MMRRVTIGVAACAALLAAGVTSASARNVVDQTTNVCSGTARWDVNLAGAYADMFIETSTCKSLNVAVEENGNPHINGTDGPYSGGYRVGLIGVTVTGTNSFVGTTTRGLQVGPLEVVSPGILNATMTGVNHTVPGHATEEHVGLESCGTICYRTKVHWYHTYDRIP
jgi:hypothetical protein